MMRRLAIFLVTAFVLGLAAASPALAQKTGASTGEPYKPDIALFKGDDSIALAPNQSLMLYGDGTIEFWVAPGWKKDPGYDPVVISNAGPDGASYLISILRDRSGVGVRSGDQEGYAPFEFTDGKLHHVAVVSEKGLTSVYVDGGLRGAFDMSFKPMKSEGVWIGSADGKTAPFVGAIGQLRIWSNALTRKEIVDFAMDNPFGGVKGEHPDLAHLLAVSDFEDHSVLVAADLQNDTGSTGSGHQVAPENIDSKN